MYRHKLSVNRLIYIKKLKKKKKERNWRENKINAHPTLNLHCATRSST